MKIPETSANVGAYYGNEENGQWQPNGVIIDSGVGGGVVGSGDAGIHRPPVYPVHIPRGHMPGYVMAGAYYPPAAYGGVPPQPAPQDDFADYMWMENEEEFDKQVMQQLEEEALMEQCIEAMLEDEQRERHNRPNANGHVHTHYVNTSNGTSSLSLEETVSRSTLNPLAAEFVPTRARVPQTQEEAVSEESTEAPSPSTEDTQHIEAVPEHTAVIDNTDQPEDEQQKTEEPLPPQKDPPEVSANSEDKKPKDRNQKPKPETKKAVKTEVKPKPKPTTVKSETKVTPKKKDVKSVKSDTKLDEKIEEVADVKSQPTPVEETQVSSGFKPINYAAAAKANKPKKPSPPPTSAAPIDKPAPKTDKPKPIEKTDKKPKTEKVNVQRKNSTK